MGSNISSDYIRGHVDIIILKALSVQDRYGYDIMKEVEKRSAGQYVLKQPTLYSSLKRLEAQGFIRPYWSEEATHGGRRKYFTLTDLGRQHVNQNLVELEYSQSIINQIVADNPQPTEEKVDAIQLKIEEKVEDVKTVEEVENKVEDVKLEEKVEESPVPSPVSQAIEPEPAFESKILTQESVLKNEELIERKNVFATEPQPTTDEPRILKVDRPVVSYQTERTDSGNVVAYQKTEYETVRSENNILLQSPHTTNLRSLTAKAIDENEVSTLKNEELSKDDILVTLKRTEKVEEQTEQSVIRVSAADFLFNRIQQPAVEEVAATSATQDVEPIQPKKETNDEINYRNKLGSMISENTVAKEETPVVRIAESQHREPPKDTFKIPEPIQLNYPINYTSLEEQTLDSGYYFKGYNKEASSPRGDLVLINKVKFFSMWILFAVMALEIALFAIIFESKVSAGTLYYCVLGLISLLVPGIATYQFALKPDYKIKPLYSLSSMMFKCIIRLVEILALFAAFILIASISLQDPKEFLPKVVLPIVLVLNYPIGIGIFYGMLKHPIFKI